MNKKVLTLCVSALLAGGMLGTVNALPANPTQIETRAVVANGLEWAGTLPTSLSSVGATVLPGFTNNSRLFVLTNSIGNITVSANKFVTVSGGTLLANSYTGGDAEAYWTMSGNDLINNANHAFTAGAYSKFDVVPVTKDGDELGCFFVLQAKNTDGSFGGYVTYTSSAFDVTAGTNAASELASAAVFVSVETAYSNTATYGQDLNKELGNGFGLTISSAKGITSISGVDVFDGTLTAKVWAGNVDANDPSKNFVDATGYNEYYLMNEDGKFIYWDETTDKDSDNPGSFVLKSAKDLNDASDKSNYKFHIYAADNGSEAVKVAVGDGTKRRLYINNTLSTGRLTALDAASTTVNVQNWAVTTLGASNSVDLRSMLQGKFLKISFAGTGKATGDAYKVGGTLAIRDNKADFVPTNSLYENAPEAHWAATYDAATRHLTLANRENPNTTLVISGMRSDDNTIYAVTSAGYTTDGDSIKIEFVNAPAISTDGYLDDYTETELRNTAFYLALDRQNADDDIPAYWAENHNASHQIGATVVKDNATKWNLAFKKKDNNNDKVEAFENQIDTVYVTSTLQTWNASTNVITDSKSRLAILPYTFQNRSNNEFVKLNDQTKLDYYICDKDNNETIDNGAAQKFIIKMKADGTYNYVPVTVNNSYDDKGLVTAASDYQFVTYSAGVATAHNKVFEGNSLTNGSWEEMSMYAKDMNSLMLVERDDAPEYRKLVSTLGVDTVSIYRDENESEVIYEQRNDNAIVDGKALSFLNIENLNDPKFDINPAIYVDSAYVNRGNNKCWQYLLAVNVEEKLNTFCPDDPTHNTEEWIAEHGVCPHAIKTPYVKARFLVNLIDTANIYGATHLHNNPYINQTEEGQDRAKLSFVPGFHVGDSLYLVTNDDTICVDLNTPNFTIGKFAFKYVDAMNSDAFKIQTAYKNYTPEATTYDPNYKNEGFLRWTNGCIVVDDRYEKGDVFNMNEDETGTPTANEEISAEEATVSVVATDGAVIVKGAEGKNVVVSTILGKVVANEVLNSDNETIAAPAGIVVVSVDGESFKVAVK